MECRRVDPHGKPNSDMIPLMEKKKAIGGAACSLFSSCHGIV